MRKSSSASVRVSLPCSSRDIRLGSISTVKGVDLLLFILKFVVDLFPDDANSKTIGSTRCAKHAFMLEADNTNNMIK